MRGSDLKSFKTGLEDLDYDQNELSDGDEGGSEANEQGTGPNGRSKRFEEDYFTGALADFKAGFTPSGQPIEESKVPGNYHGAAGMH